MLKLTNINIALTKLDKTLEGEAQLIDSQGVITVVTLSHTAAAIMTAALQVDLASQGEQNDTH